MNQVYLPIVSQGLSVQQVLLLQHESLGASIFWNQELGIYNIGFKDDEGRLNFKNLAIVLLLEVIDLKLVINCSQELSGKLIGYINELKLILINEEILNSTDDVGRKELARGHISELNYFINKWSEDIYLHLIYNFIYNIIAAGNKEMKDKIGFLSLFNVDFLSKTTLQKKNFLDKQKEILEAILLELDIMKEQQISAQQIQIMYYIGLFHRLMGVFNLGNYLSENYLNNWQAFTEYSVKYYKDATYHSWIVRFARLSMDYYIIFGFSTNMWNNRHYMEILIEMGNTYSQVIDKDSFQVFNYQTFIFRMMACLLNALKRKETQCKGNITNTKAVFEDLIKVSFFMMMVPLRVVHLDNHPESALSLDSLEAIVSNTPLLQADEIQYVKRLIREMEDVYVGFMQSRLNIPQPHEIIMSNMGYLLEHQRNEYVEVQQQIEPVQLQHITREDRTNSTEVNNEALGVDGLFSLIQEPRNEDDIDNWLRTEFNWFGEINPNS